MNVLYDAELNAQVPEEITKRLAQVDPNLFLKYVKYPNHETDIRDRNHWWALCLRWADSDKRRRWVASGEMPEDAAFDIIGYMPFNIGDINDCFDHMVSILKKQEKHPTIAAKELLERVHFFNKTQQVENVKPTMELAEELITTNVKTMFEAEGKGIPKVFVTDAKNKGR